MHAVDRGLFWKRQQARVGRRAPGWHHAPRRARARPRGWLWAGGGRA